MISLGNAIEVQLEKYVIMAHYKLIEEDTYEAKLFIRDKVVPDYYYIDTLTFNGTKTSVKKQLSHYITSTDLSDYIKSVEYSYECFEIGNKQKEGDLS